MTRIMALSGLLVAFTLANAQAGEVSVKGVHLCCGQCVKIIGAALGKVKGVSDPSCDRDSKTVSFTSSNEKSAKAGLRAILNAGFYGRATLDGEKLTAFNSKGKKKNKKRADKKSSELTLYNVHLCCGMCVKAIGGALKKIDGVSEVACDREARTVKLTGDEISRRAVVAALHKIGFNGRTTKPKAKKKKKKD